MKGGAWIVNPKFQHREEFVRVVLLLSRSVACAQTPATDMDAAPPGFVEPSASQTAKRDCEQIDNAALVTVYTKEIVIQYY